MLLFCDDSLVLQPLCGNVGKLDWNHPMIRLCFRDIFYTLKQEMVRNDNEEMVWKEEDAMDRQRFVGYG